MASQATSSRCLIHFSSVNLSALTKFTVKSLKRVVECRKEWLQYSSSPQREISEDSLRLFSHHSVAEILLNRRKEVMWKAMKKIVNLTFLNCFTIDNATKDLLIVVN